MKPHIKKIQGLWFCALLPNKRIRLYGYGYTPKQAYDDWRAQQ